MSASRRQAEQAATARALARMTGPTRLLRVLEVRPGAGAGGGPLIVLDWAGDGASPAPARRNLDAPVPAAGDEVLVVLVGRTPVVVCRTGDGPPTP